MKKQLIEKRLPELQKLMSPCRLCPRKCGVDRLNGQKGYCRTGDRVKVAAWAQHRGEEPGISGIRGSGTIFSSNCTLGCFFCQNFPFSQLGNGREMDRKELGQIMSKLADSGVHNLNFVTPTHVIPLLLEGLLESSDKAIALPLVYNCSGYETEEVLDLLDGIVDIYIPDIKYADDKIAEELSQCPDYVENNRISLKKMYRQAGDLQFSKDGIATRGLIIRHLVLPEQLAGSRESFTWLANNLGLKVHISLMSQYFPAFKAHQHPKMGRALEVDEYLEVLDFCEELGFENVWAQDPTERGGA